MKRQILEHEADEIMTKKPRGDEDEIVEEEELIFPQQTMRKHDGDKTNYAAARSSRADDIRSNFPYLNKFIYFIPYDEKHPEILWNELMEIYDTSIDEEERSNVENLELEYRLKSICIKISVAYDYLTSANNMRLMSDREVIQYKKMSMEENVLFQNDKMEEASRILAIIGDHEDPRQFTKWIFSQTDNVDGYLPNSGSVEVYNPRMEVLKVLKDLFIDVNSFNRNVVSDYELSLIVRLKEIYDKAF